MDLLEDYNIELLSPFRWSNRAGVETFLIAWYQSTNYTEQCCRAFIFFSKCRNLQGVQSWFWIHNLWKGLLECGQSIIQHIIYGLGGI